VKNVFSVEGRAFLRLHPMSRRNAARAEAFLHRSGFFFCRSAPRPLPVRRRNRGLSCMGWMCV